MAKTPEQLTEDLRNLDERRKKTRRWVFKTTAGTLAAAGIAVVSLKVGYAMDAQKTEILDREAPAPSIEKLAPAEEMVKTYENTARLLGKEGRVEELPPLFNQEELRNSYSIKAAADYRIQKHNQLNTQNKLNKGLCEVGVVAGAFGTIIGTLMTTMGIAALKQMNDVRNTITQKLRTQHG